MGRPDVDRMLGEITARQFAEWLAFLEVEGPIGEERADLRAGIIAATVANSLGSGRGRPKVPADFMPRFESPAPKRQTWQEQRDYLTGLARMMGG